MKHSSRNTIWIIVGVAAVLVAVVILYLGHPGSRQRIGVIAKASGSLYWERVRRGAIKAAQEERYEIEWNSPQSDTDYERQIQIAEQMIAQPVAGIVLAPNDGKALAPLVDKIHADGIPCVTIHSPIETDKYLSFIATDESKGGALAAERIGGLLRDTGTVVIARWAPSSASADAMARGFRATLAEKFGEIKIIDSNCPGSTTTETREIAEDMLTKHGRIDAVFACDGATTAAALQPLRRRPYSQKDIKLVGVEAWPVLTDALQRGELDSLVTTNPYLMGYEAVKAVVHALQGQEVPKRIDTGVELLTAERLADPAVRERLSLQ